MKLPLTPTHPAPPLKRVGSPAVGATGAVGTGGQKEAEGQPGLCFGRRLVLRALMRFL